MVPGVCPSRGSHVDMHIGPSAPWAWPRPPPPTMDLISCITSYCAACKEVDLIHHVVLLLPFALGLNTKLGACGRGGRGKTRALVLGAKHRSVISRETWLTKHEGCFSGGSYLAVQHLCRDNRWLAKFGSALVKQDREGIRESTGCAEVDMASESTKASLTGRVVWSAHAGS